MNVLGRFFVVISLFSAFSYNVYARGNSAYEETYHIGLLGGTLDGGAEYGSVDATGFVLSARNSKAVLEYVNFGSAEGSILTGGGTWEANVSGIYLSLLGQGQPYMKFKVGNVKHEMVSTVGGTTSIETSDFTSYGLGMGYKVGSRLMIEFDVTTLDNDMTLFALTFLF